MPVAVNIPLDILVLSAERMRARWVDLAGSIALTGTNNPKRAAGCEVNLNRLSRYTLGCDPSGTMLTDEVELLR
jgi:hypothetical protein